MSILTLSALKCSTLEFCLRQVGEPEEDVHVKEWKLDVPTIGAVYRQSDVVCYLSGLDQSLSLKKGDLDSHWCWFRHAWTLQEVTSRMVIAGDTPDGPLHVKSIDEDGNYKTMLLIRFHRQLQSIYDFRYGDMSVALKRMQNQMSTNPVDKVAGLAHLLKSEIIPTYHETQSLEDAWTALVNSMDVWYQGKLFILYSESENSGTKWRPSWNQIIMRPLLIVALSYSVVHRGEMMDEDWHNVHCIKSGLVWGLAVVEGVD
ncbi:hypothetical protein DFS33DRAFT_1383717 [Desarmillaria ectypa]|nr:hypothetical protein DFS33DRAFT_1383717 [Desarmillaria ectypa]